MGLFRVFLIALWSVLAVYTAIVLSKQGLNLFPYFFGDIAKFEWPGQFNLDFMMFLSLSALWTAWRHKFSSLGLGLSVVAFFGGIGFLAPYLLYLSFKTKGDTKAMLLGNQQDS
ncbi:MAG: hypothetical protein AAF296_04985 [Pseudomonadota bacterium]